MSLAWISVAALVLAITLSCTTTINVGVLSLALALAVGVGLADMSVGRVLDGFPTDLFITLLGVTLLFAIAEVNGTLARLTERPWREAPHLRFSFWQFVRQVRRSNFARFSCCVGAIR